MQTTVCTVISGQSKFLSLLLWKVEDRLGLTTSQSAGSITRGAMRERKEPGKWDLLMDPVHGFPVAVWDRKVVKSSRHPAPRFPLIVYEMRSS